MVFSESSCYCDVVVVTDWTGSGRTGADRWGEAAEGCSAFGSGDFSWEACMLTFILHQKYNQFCILFHFPLYILGLIILIKNSKLRLKGSSICSSLWRFNISMLVFPSPPNQNVLCSGQAVEGFHKGNRSILTKSQKNANPFKMIREHLIKLQTNGEGII